MLPIFYFQRGEIMHAVADLRTQSVLRDKLEAQVYTDVETAWEQFGTSRAAHRAHARAGCSIVPSARAISSRFSIRRAQRRCSSSSTRSARSSPTNQEYYQDLANYWTAIFQLEQAVGTGSSFDLRTRKSGSAGARSCAIGACTSHANETNAPPVPAGQAWLTPQQLKDASIIVMPVGMHAVGGAIVTSGRITFDDLRVAHVFSPVSGRVTKILAQPNQRVKKDPDARHHPVARPRSGVLRSRRRRRPRRTQADKDFKRQNELYDAHAGAQRDFEAAKAVSMAAKAELTRAQRKAHLLASAGGGGDTQEFPLRSPIEGEVIIRNVNPGVEVQGQYGGGGQAVELFTIGELDRVWVMADVFEIDLAKVKQGSHVSVKVVAYPDRIFEGVVEYVADTLDPASRTARVRISVDNKERMLKPEMFATVQIAIDQRKALAIPRTALLRLGDQNVVFVQVGTTKTGELEFERRPVAVDEEQGGDFLPVTHGLNDGDKVVSSGGILLLGML